MTSSVPVNSMYVLASRKVNLNLRMLLEVIVFNNQKIINDILKIGVWCLVENYSILYFARQTPSGALGSVWGATS